MPQHYTLWIVTPPGYAHSRCFEEVALSLQAAFKALGDEVPIVTDPAQVKGRVIALGANLLPSLQSALPPQLILFNLEQITPGSSWLKPAYIEFLRRYPVWDYSALNVKKLKDDFGIDAVALCGIGYMPALTRIAKAAAEDIDVLFIGSLNPRRQTVLEAIARHGKSVSAAFNSYGEQRDALIARAKLVLNIHFYEAQIFEIVRVSYLLANRKCVVSETGFDDALEAPLRKGVAFAPYADLTETCLRLLDNATERAQLAAIGFDCFSAQSQIPMLKRALAALPES